MSTQGKSLKSLGDEKSLFCRRSIMEMALCIKQGPTAATAECCKGKTDHLKTREELVTGANAQTVNRGLDIAGTAES